MNIHIEKFLREIGLEPAERVRASRNPLESPWSLGEEEFVRRVGRDGLKAYQSAREETLSLTASREAVRVEKEIDERVKALYGLSVLHEKGLQYCLLQYCQRLGFSPPYMVAERR